MRTTLLCLLLAFGARADETPALQLSGGLTFSVPVKNMATATAFYRDVLGLKPTESSEHWTEFATHTGALTIGLSLADKDTPAGAGSWMTFGVKDMAAALATLRKGEARIVGEVQTIPGLVKLATFLDPDGNRFKLYQLLQAQGAALPKLGALGYTGAVVVAHSTTDMKAAQAWYTKHLGFRLFFNLDQMGWAEMGTPLPGISFGLMTSTEKPAAGGPTLIWEVADIAAERAKLEKHGVRFVGETATIPDKVKLATFLDADQNRLRLAQSLKSAGSGQDTKDKE
ncbi:MAG: VOC family protein [Planctomycetota bacterium]